MATTPSWYQTKYGTTDKDKQYFGRQDYTEAIRFLAKGSGNVTDRSKLASAGTTIADYLFPGDKTYQSARSGLKIGEGVLKDIGSRLTQNYITGQYGTDKTNWGLADYEAMRSWGYTDKHIWERFLKNKTTGFETGHGVNDAQGIYKYLKSRADQGWPASSSATQANTGGGSSTSTNHFTPNVTAAQTSTTFTDRTRDTIDSVSGTAIPVQKQYLNLADKDTYRSPLLSKPSSTSLSIKGSRKSKKYKSALALTRESRKSEFT